jgi:hypothetical protein
MQLTGKFVQRKDLTAVSQQVTESAIIPICRLIHATADPQKESAEIEMPAVDGQRGRLVFLYFQCSEWSEINRQTSGK